MPGIDEMFQNVTAVGDCAWGANQSSQRGGLLNSKGCTHTTSQCM